MKWIPLIGAGACLITGILLLWIKGLEVLAMIVLAVGLLVTLIPWNFGNQS